MKKRSASEAVWAAEPDEELVLKVFVDIIEWWLGQYHQSAFSVTREAMSPPMLILSTTLSLDVLEDNR